MTKVPRNKGSYAVRPGGGVQVKYPLGWSEAKKKYDEYIETVDSEAEAIALIKEINDFVYHGGNVKDVPTWRKGGEGNPKSMPTVAEFAESFISMREKQGAVEVRTTQSDRECFSRIEPYIGRLKLDELSAQEIEAAYTHMRSSGQDNVAGRVYAGTTLLKTHVFLRMLLNKAIDYGYIDRNPCSKVDSPKRDTREKTALTLSEAQALFGAIADSPLAAKPVGVALSLSCGLRLSEMLALKWHDYSNGSISVTKSLVREKQAFKATKTGESRVVPCPPAMALLLEEWKDEQQNWYKEYGLVWSDDAPIVQSRVGNHVLQRSYTRWFAQARKKYPIPDSFTFHGLRHTYITLLARDCSVDPRTARSMSGHKTEQAFGIYTHTNVEWQRRAADRLGSIIAPDNHASCCGGCAHWAASPHDPTRGVCWGLGEEGITVCLAASRCSTGNFERRMAHAS